MKQTTTSTRIPTKSSPDDVLRDVRLDNTTAVEDMDAIVEALNFINGVKTGVYTAKLVEYKPSIKEVKQNPEILKNLKYFSLEWEVEGLNGKRYSKVYLNNRLENWCKACDRRTANGAYKLARKQGFAEPNIFHRLETLKAMPEVSVNYDFYSPEQEKPAISLWLPADFKEAREARRNYIPG